jgi:hypothetical protein
MVGRAISKYATFLMKQELEALIGMTIRQTERLLATGEVAWDHAKAGIAIAGAIDVGASRLRQRDR